MWEQYYNLSVNCALVGHCTKFTNHHYSNDAEYLNLQQRCCKVLTKVFFKAFFVTLSTFLTQWRTLMYTP